MNMEKILSKLEGRIIGFGIKEENYLKIIDKNKKIIECSLLNSIDLQKEKKGFGRNRQIFPKNLKKIYGYKNIDTIIINEKEIKFLEKRLLPKFIYLTSKSIYIYNIDDVEKIMKRYKRYKVNIKKINKDNKLILKVDVSLSKTKKILEPFYFLYDAFIDYFDVISELLVS